jgi:hypothetical protein
MFMSLHANPFAWFGFEHVPVSGLHVPGTWHWSSAVQTTGFEPVQVPAWHVSVCVQRSASLHAAPSDLLGFEQEPLAGLHVPATWHWSSGVHVTGFAPVQVPAWHESVWVHALPSLHAAPFARFGFEQEPLAGLHVPATWHWSSGVHVTGFAPVQVPAWQVSVWVHALPSLQAEPSDLLGFEQVPFAGLHVPASWHWSSGEQTTGLAPVHVPDWQVSVWVHALPSLQAAPFALVGFEQVPVAELQVPAVWHWSRAVHVTGFEPLQLPPWHVSVCVHRSPSLHDVPLALLGLEQVPFAGLQVPASWH